MRALRQCSTVDTSPTGRNIGKRKESRGRVREALIFRHLSKASIHGRILRSRSRLKLIFKYFFNRTIEQRLKMDLLRE